MASFSRLFSSTLCTLACIASLPACKKAYDFSLPNSNALGNPRGYRIVRSLNHMHSPYSWDACDKQGLVGTIPNATCIQHLKEGLCTNRVDFAFLTDHPDNMQNFEMRELLLAESKDTIVLKNNLPYVNQLGTCSNSFVPSILVGFEARIMAMGMTKHLDSSIATRADLYHLETLELKNRLSSETDALVIIPHTEGQTTDWIQSIQPDGIEIYNFHANIDPKIRKRDLGLPPFLNIPGLLSFLVDPYNQLVPDYAFLNFIELYSLTFQKWNTLVYSGLKVVGLGGTDSHENVFPQKVSDGERLDSHRRIIKMMSNHVLVTNSDPDEVKQAIKAGRSWVVFEGFGSPYQMDFYANVSAGVVGVGETGSLNGNSATIIVKAPVLASQSPQGSEKPIIRLALKRVLAGGKDETIASSEGKDIQYQTSTAGAYRVEIKLIPRHLRDFLGTFSDQADQEFMWIITNHLYLNS